MPERGGFTLTELLVVIAIVAILAAMLLPALSRAKAQAQSAKCKSNLHQMGLALNMYLADFHVYPPWISPPDNNGVRRHWSSELEPYSRIDWTNASFHCPAYKGPIVQSSDGEGYCGSYGYNRWGVSPQTVAGPRLLGLDGFKNSPGAILVGEPVREGLVVAPSEMFAIMDARAIIMGGLAGNPLFGIDWAYCCQWDEPFPLLMQPPQHDKNFNVLCCDAHVVRVKTSDLFNPTNTAPNWNSDHQPHPEDWF